jgi:hypothetical protein
MFHVWLSCELWCNIFTVHIFKFNYFVASLSHFEHYFFFFALPVFPRSLCWEQSE